ncbi:MAG: flap endonuclease-1 [Candidatus Diapherotrites archaeon]|nr:flap endonuclease-1 [Candidatus Diapherotrites archaeon]
MGVQLGDLLTKKEIEFEELSGKIIGIDAFNTLYQFLAIIRSRDGTPLMDSKGRITSHLSGLFYRTANLIQLGIKPVYVFDGKPPKLKEKTREKRKEIREKAEKKYEEALKEGAIAEARKYAQQAIKLSDEMVEDAKTLLDYMGIAYLQAPSEGEAQLAWMCENNLIYASASQDYDALLFGSPLLIRNLTISGKRKAPGKNYYYDIKPEQISLQENLEALGITREKLIWIGILVGTDFNEKFKGIGPKRALELVKKYDSFDEIIKATNQTIDFDWKAVEEIFLKPKIDKQARIKEGKLNKEKLLEFLCEEHNFSIERVKNTVEKIETKLSERGVQSNLSGWF